MSQQPCTDFETTLAQKDNTIAQLQAENQTLKLKLADVQQECDIMTSWKLKIKQEYCSELSTPMSNQELAEELLGSYFTPENFQRQQSKIQELQHTLKSIAGVL